MKVAIVIFAVLCGAAVLAYLLSEIKTRAEKSSGDFTGFETREDVDENEPAWPKTNPLLEEENDGE